MRTFGPWARQLFYFLSLTPLRRSFLLHVNKICTRRREMNQADESNSQTATESDCAWWGGNETLIFDGCRHKGAAVFGEQIKKTKTKQFSEALYYLLLSQNLALIKKNRRDCDCIYGRCPLRPPSPQKNNKTAVAHFTKPWRMCSRADGREIKSICSRIRVLFL